MKKLTKKSLDKLAKIMPIIDDAEKELYMGMYNYDCFWRCIAYMDNGGNSVSESQASAYALSYFTESRFGCSVSADYYLSMNGAGMSIGDMQDYIAYAVSNGSYGPGSVGGTSYIGIFNTNNISAYNDTSTSHAVVITSVNPDGSLNYVDPQNSEEGTIPASEAQYVTRAMY